MGATGNIGANTGYKIGKHVSAGCCLLSGSLDEFRIWNTPRTKCQINTFMNCEIPTIATGLAPVPFKIVAWPLQTTELLIVAPTVKANGVEKPFATAPGETQLDTVPVNAKLATQLFVMAKLPH